MAHGKQRDKESRQACPGKHPPFHPGLIGILLQPLVHDQPGDRGRDQDGDTDDLQEIARQEKGDGRHRRAQYLPDPDLFCALRGGEGSQAE